MRKGSYHTEEAKKKIGEAGKGRKHTTETKKKISAANKGCKPWNKGKTGVYSKEALEKLSESNKGRTHSEESKLKMSIAKKGNKHALGREVSNETRKKIGEANKGKIPSEEVKRRISKSLKGKKHTGETKKKMSNSRISYMQSNKYIFRPTSIELLMEEQLKNAGIFYISQYYLKRVGFIDFFLPKYNILIECDGNYFHNLPGAQQKDADRDLKAMFLYGYMTIRLWEHEIKKSPKACMNKLSKRARLRSNEIQATSH